MPLANIAAKAPTAYEVKWSPSYEQVVRSQIYRFGLLIENTYGVSLPDYKSLWRWSVENREDFWSQVWDFCGVTGDKQGAVLSQPGDIQTARFFQGSKLNYAENLLKRRDSAVALISKGEMGGERTLTFKELYDSVSRVRQMLQSYGVAAGDRVAGFLPNTEWGVICMLAASSLGAVWSSASPDFGVQGVLDRFGQIEPKVLFAVDGYSYGGKQIDCLPKVADIVAKLPSLVKCVIVHFIHPNPDASGIKNAVRLEDALQGFTPADIAFERFAFNHPLFIMFSSGTTGVPKCIVHGAGGTLIQHLKEHQLHCDIKKVDRVFYFTTLGWMMWNWQVSALASGAGLMLYDGSPFHPDGEVLFAYAENYKCTLFGASAKYIDSLKVNGYRPINEYDLSTVRVITSTGSPLAHESFDYVYNHIHANAQLASISGGTDIVSCFVLGNPVSPVYRGEIQGAGLGMDVDVFDDAGRPMASGKGELVCKASFPAMPIGFWNDADGAKYKKAYFERFPGIWCHGDWCEWTENSGLIIHGRSDATLNPGGVRIGTAEIYRQVEKLPEVKESIAVGQDFEGDVRVVLFVVLQNGVSLSEELKTRIKKTIRDGTSPRHVPAKIIQVADIPRTKSGKITELAVRDVIHGRVVRNVEALANPAALDLYKGLTELEKA